MTQKQTDESRHEHMATHRGLIEWCLIITIACFGIIGLIQGLFESSVLLSAVCGLILAGVSIFFMRDRFHDLLERYEFAFIWIIILSIAGYSIYHVITGVTVLV